MHYDRGCPVTTPALPQPPSAPVTPAPSAATGARGRTRDTGNGGVAGADTPAPLPFPKVWRGSAVDLCLSFVRANRLARARASLILSRASARYLKDFAACPGCTLTCCMTRLFQQRRIPGKTWNETINLPPECSMMRIGLAGRRV